MLRQLSIQQLLLVGGGVGVCKCTQRHGTLMRYDKSINSCFAYCCGEHVSQAWSYTEYQPFLAHFLGIEYYGHSCKITFIDGKADFNIHTNYNTIPI